MSTKAKNWTKTELQVYILLLCANADTNETKEELEMIRSKVDMDTFEKMEGIFRADSEEKRLKKIDRNIHQHHYSAKELSAFKREMYKVFFSDCNFSMLEKRLDWTLDNILY